MTARTSAQKYHVQLKCCMCKILQRAGLQTVQSYECTSSSLSALLVSNDGLQWQSGSIANVHLSE